VLVIASIGAIGQGCASGRGRGVPTTGAPGATPWELPPQSIPSQRIFQGSYEGPEGGGSFRATLRLVAPDRFRLDASDRLGRLLWSLELDGSRAWWVDHHAGVWCPDLSRITLPGVGAGPVGATALPAFLLGALPAAPAGGSLAPTAVGELRDTAGRRWTWTVDRGTMDGWTLWEDEAAIWWWRRNGSGGILSHRQGRQLRWQEVVAEPLRGGLPPPAIPTGYREACDAASVRR
jgi:hypothetical protein